MKALLIAGPTASGKSALALAAARARGAAIVNADSMQVYRDLRVLTARPSADDAALVPHRLDGSVDAAVNYSTGAWLRDAEAAMRELAGRPVIFAGGTGLYFKALTRGLSKVPEIPDAIRDDVRSRLARDGAVALHTVLARRDPEASTRLSVNDGVRIARALEVVEATGRTLNAWQSERSAPLLEAGSYDALFLTLDRETLYRRIDARFDAMLAAGALDEVAALRSRQLDPLLPAMKAHGVPALIRHLAGELSLAEAAEIGKADTRHYAKRQFTWFRHQLPEFDWVGAEEAWQKLAL